MSVREREEGRRTEIRVLRVIARLNIGGPAIQAVTLSEGLASKGYRTLLACGTVGSSEGDMEYLACEKGVEPVPVPFLGRELSPLDDIRSFFALRSLIRRFDPHVLHSHTAKAGTLGRLAAMSVNLARPHSRRIRVIHTFHGHVFHGYFSSRAAMIFRLIEKCLSRFTDRVVVISDLQKHDICRKYFIVSERKVSVIPLGFDLAPFTAKNKSIYSRKEMDDRQPFEVVSVGRLTAVKNHAMLVDAMIRLKGSGSLDNFIFTIVGDGELRESVAGRAEEGGVGSALIFDGWRRDMPEVYQRADAVVLTSRNEGTPVALIEAMAAGCPVIATDVGGVRDLLGNPLEELEEGVFRAPRGLLVSSDDSASLARALCVMRKDPDLREKTAGRAKEFVVRKYGIERLYADIDSLYREVLAR